MRLAPVLDRFASPSMALESLTPGFPSWCWFSQTLGTNFMPCTKPRTWTVLAQCSLPSTMLIVLPRSSPVKISEMRISGRTQGEVLSLLPIHTSSECTAFEYRLGVPYVEIFGSTVCSLARVEGRGNDCAPASGRHS